MEANQAVYEDTIARAKKYAAAAKYAQLRGQHRRAALLYMVAATLLDPSQPPSSPLALSAQRLDVSKNDT